MPTPQEKLAQSLEALHELQGRGVVAIRSDDLSRTDRERLLESGFLKEVMKGWYIPSRPDESAGDSTGVVRLVLGLLRRVSRRPFWRGMVPLARAVFVTARWKPICSRAAIRARAERRQQTHTAATRHIPV